MSRFDYDIHEKHDFYMEPFAVPECANCHASGLPLSDVLLNDGGSALLCDDCVEEERRQEAKATELVNARPSLLCEERDAIVDSATSTNNLVNRLVAHDMNCAICAGRIPVRSERSTNTITEARA